MKKALLSALIFFACMLSACGGEHSVSGRIVEADTDPGVGLVSFVVRTDRDKEVGILLTDETHIFTFVDGLDADTFREGAQTDVAVTVTYDPSRRSLVTEDGNKVTAYNATHIEVEACRLPDTARLSDGTELEVWQSSRYLTYFLPDGTELLRVNTPVGPSADYMVGQESLDSLSDQARNKILAWYDDRGLLYDEQAELEKTYAYYLAAGNTPFEAPMLAQEVTPSAASDRVFYLLTSVSFPAGSSLMYEQRTGAAFDKATGDFIPAADLFTCPWEDVLSQLLDLAQITDPDLRQEMSQAFTPECLIFFPEYVMLCFPQGSLPSQEYTFLVTVNYADGASALLQDWAVPAAPAEEPA